MKTREHTTETTRKDRFEADLESSIEALFRRCPTLCGFSVRTAGSQLGIPKQLANALLVTDVSDYPWTGLEAPAELCDEIVAALVELTDECPGTYELLRERSFARIRH